MNFLRLVCLMAGLVVLVAPPAMLFPNGGALPDLGRSVALQAALLLAASSFFFIGIAGHRIKRSRTLGRLSALLLLAPFLAGAATLWASAHPPVLWMGGALLSFTLIVSLALGSMLLAGPSPSRVRAREGRRNRLVALRQD